jgi:hypothetical protein
MTRPGRVVGDDGNPYATPEVSELAAFRPYRGASAAVIRVRRPFAYFGIVRKLRVALDAHDVVQLAARQEIACTVRPGAHVVGVSMDWCSCTTTVEVAAGGECVLEARAASFLLASLFSFVAPDRVFRLALVAGG